MVLKEKSLEVFNLIKSNGGRVKVEDLKAATGRTGQSIGASITDLGKKNLALRDEVDEGEDKPTKYVVLTDEGMNYDPATATDEE